jgi:hypothetical protein
MLCLCRTLFGSGAVTVEFSLQLCLFFYLIEVTRCYLFAVRTVSYVFNILVAVASLSPLAGEHWFVPDILRNRPFCVGEPGVVILTAAVGCGAITMTAV